MQHTYILSFEYPDVTPDNRLRLKHILGEAVRDALLTDVPVAIDHLGLPIRPDQIPEPAA